MDISKILFTIFVLINIAQGERCKARLHVAIMLDMSASISSSNWIEVKKLTEEIINGFDVGENTVKVSVMTFSEVVEYISMRSSSREPLLAAIQSYDRKDATTNTHLALKGLRQTVFAPYTYSGVAPVNIAVFVSDGISNQRNQTREETVAIHSNKDIPHVFTIGLGKQDQDIMEAIASTPASAYSLNMDDFTNWKHLAELLTKRICDHATDVYSGINCTKKADCNQISGICSSSKLCKCIAQSFRYDKTKQTCEPRFKKIGLQVTCGTDFDCSFVHGAVCKNGICVCYPSGSTSCKPCILSAACYGNIDCRTSISGWTCFNNSQSCTISRRQISPYICQVNKIGDDCTIDQQCGEVDGAACLSGVCKCKQSSYIFEESSLKCRERKIDDFCQDSKDCTLRNSECRSHTCQCSLGYHADSSKEKCLNCAIGLNCFNSTCNKLVNNSVCTCSGYLDCDRTFILKNNTCTRVDFLDPCRPGIGNGDCVHLNSSACVNGICQCKPGYAFDSSSNTCKQLLLGDACPGGNPDCVTVLNGICNNKGECGCKKGYHNMRQEVCLPYLKVGEVCSGDDECGYEGMICKKASNDSTPVCRCNDAYVVNGSMCSPLLNSQCHRDEDCGDGQNMVCPNQTKGEKRKCTCDSQFMPNPENTCSPAALGSPCPPGANFSCTDFISNTICEEKTKQCRCLPYFTDNGFACGGGFVGLLFLCGLLTLVICCCFLIPRWRAIRITEAETKKNGLITSIAETFGSGYIPIIGQERLSRPPSTTLHVHDRISVSSTNNTPRSARGEGGGDEKKRRLEDKYREPEYREFRTATPGSFTHVELRLPNTASNSNLSYIGSDHMLNHYSTSRA